MTSVHLIGIGGCGMAALAELLLARGAVVSGSDTEVSARTSRLVSLGARVFSGHHPENLGSADLVVVSSAIGSANPELAQARNLGIPTIHRGELLARLSNPYPQRLFVAGSHGKTTTSSLLTSIWTHAGLSPTVAVGGTGPLFPGGAAAGPGPWFIGESDESDGSFLLLAPTRVVLTNLGQDHVSHYGSQEAMEAAFARFVASPSLTSPPVVCADNPAALAAVPKDRITYGLAPGAQVRGVDVEHLPCAVRFTPVVDGSLWAPITLPLPGIHNVQNALGALGSAWSAGIPQGPIRAGLEGFPGVHRRHTVVGRAGPVTVIDDYAHNPEKILAAIGGIRDSFPARTRIVAVFEPHRPSRVSQLWEGFCRAFPGAQSVWVAPLCKAGECGEIDLPALAQGIRQHSRAQVQVSGDLGSLPGRILADLRRGEATVVVTLGAGEITQVATELLALLQS